MFLHTAGPHEALVKTTRGRRSQIVVAGTTLVVPFLQRVDRVSLRLRTIRVRSENALSAENINVQVTAICQVKVRAWAYNPDTEEIFLDTGSLRIAAEHFIKRSDADINRAIQASLEGHQRAILSALTLREMYADRSAWSAAVIHHAAPDLARMGLEILSYVVSELSDKDDILSQHGVRSVALVKRNATEARALHESVAEAVAARAVADAELRVNTAREACVRSDGEFKEFDAECRTAVAREINKRRRARPIANSKQNAVLHKLQQYAREVEAAGMKECEEARLQVQHVRTVLLRNVHEDAQLYRTKMIAKARQIIAEAEAYRDTIIGEAESYRNDLLAKCFMDMQAMAISILNQCKNEAFLVALALEILPAAAEAHMLGLKEIPMSWISVGHDASTAEFEEVEDETHAVHPADDQELSNGHMKRLSATATLIACMFWRWRRTAWHSAANSRERRFILM